MLNWNLWWCVQETQRCTVQYPLCWYGCVRWSGSTLEDGVDVDVEFVADGACILLEDWTLVSTFVLLLLFWMMAWWLQSDRNALLFLVLPLTFLTIAAANLHILSYKSVAAQLLYVYPLILFGFLLYGRSIYGRTVSLFTHFVIRKHMLCFGHLGYLW